MTDWVVPGMGPAGFWIGFIIGLTSAAVMMVWRMRRLQQQPAAVILARAAH
jgi:MATE family multidrug resistance protein